MVLRRVVERMQLRKSQTMHCHIVLSQGMMVDGSGDGILMFVKHLHIYANISCSYGKGNR